MNRSLEENWWLLGARGVVTFGFGVFLLLLAGTMRGMFSTAIALVAVLIVFVFFLATSGVLLIVAAVRLLTHRQRGAVLLQHGLLLLGIGAWLFSSRHFSLVWMIWFTAAHAFTCGIHEIALAYHLREHRDALLLTVMGVLSLLLCLVMATIRDSMPALSVTVLGVYAAFYGAVLVSISIRLKDGRKTLQLVARA